MAEDKRRKTIIHADHVYNKDYEKDRKKEKRDKEFALVAPALILVIILMLLVVWDIIKETL